jgi:uroporphyrinogen-III synthase
VKKSVRVIVTRPLQEATVWVRDLTLAGWPAVALPLIDIASVNDSSAVHAAWERLHTFDAVMFVSSNAVEHFFRCKPGSSQAFTGCNAIKTRAFATGPGTVAALLRVGVPVASIDAPDADAAQFDSEALWAVMGHRVQPGWRVLVVRGGVDASQTGAGRDWFSQQVRAAGGEVELVAAYQRALPVWDAPQRAVAQQAAEDGSVWLFSSSQAIGHLLTLCPQQTWGNGRAVATHPRIAHAARQAGFAVVCESRPHLASVVASIESMQ